MKAIIWTNYGSPDVLQLQEVEKPVPKDNEVLIKIHATTATTADCEARSLNFSLWLAILMRLYVGLLRPIRIKVLGQELSGEIEAVGKDITLFKKGDQVFLHTGFAMGAYSEYICRIEKPDGMNGVLAIKPGNMTYEEAAAVPLGGLEALHFIRQGKIQSGQKVLINGAGGSIGTFAVQLAKYFGAEVTAVDRSEKLEMLRGLGADDVIDFTQEDFTRNGKLYDVILDVMGKSSFSRSLRSVTQNGSYLLANPRFSDMVRGWWHSMRSSKKVIFGAAELKHEDLIFLKELIEADKLKSVIDRSYRLEQIPEAHRYVETGQKKGHVVITVA